MSAQPKTTEQLRAIFGLGKKLGFDKERLEELASVQTAGQVERLSLLSFDQANAMIVHLGGDAFPQSALSDPLSAVPRRTVNHHKQKAGIVTMASPKALALMDRLAAERNMTPEGLERMCLRMLKKKRPTTAKGCSAVIEAIKKMNARDKKPTTRRAA